MLDPEKNELLNKIEKQVKLLVRSFVLLIAFLVLAMYLQLEHPEKWSPKPEVELVELEEELPEFENGIHLESGLKEGEDLQLIIANCTSCHSAKMITQNRATREGWLHMIEWMQETQNLWELGDNEPLILDYLAANYAPEKKGRRAPLMNIDWYELED